MGPSHVLHRSINRSIFATILTLWASLVIAPQATAAMPGLTDAQTYPPPTSGPYAYQTFTPNQPDFLDLGESYVDPVFETTITRVSNVHPDTGSGILYGINGYWNADASLYLQSNVSGVDLINPATGAIVVQHVPFTIGWAVSFDLVNADVYDYTSGTKLMQYRVSSRSSSALKAFNASLGGLGGSAHWISANGRWFVLNLGGSIQVWDRQRNAIYSGSAPLTGIPPGWASLSPDGSYVIRSPTIRSIIATS